MLQGGSRGSYQANHKNFRCPSPFPGARHGTKPDSPTFSFESRKKTLLSSPSLCGRGKGWGSEKPNVFSRDTAEKWQVRFTHLRLPHRPPSHTVGGPGSQPGSARPNADLHGPMRTVPFNLHNSRNLFYKCKETRETQRGRGIRPKPQRERGKERVKENTVWGLGDPCSSKSPSPQRPAPPPPSPRAPLTGRRKGRPVPVAPNRLRGASLPGGGRRAASVRAGGGRRGRGGRRRRWQPAGTHAAPRPARPAALPPAAATARCPLTSGGECGDPHHREAPSAGPLPAWHAKTDPGSVHALAGPPGDPRSAACRTQSEPDSRGAPSCSPPPPRARPPASGATPPLPPQSPLPGLPPPQPVLTPRKPAASSHHTGRRTCSLLQMGVHKPSAPRSPLEHLLSSATPPTDRSVPGTSNEPPRIPRGLRPITPASRAAAGEF